MCRKTALVIGILFCVPPPANAYIDPTAGGLLIQMLLAGGAGIAVVAKLYWKRIMTRFKGSVKEEENK